MEKEQKMRVLETIAHQLNTANIRWAVGGSMLLYLHNIAQDFRDIDVMVKTEDAELAKAIFARMGTLAPPRPSARYQSKAFFELTVDGVEVDVMAGFTIVKDGRKFDRSLQERDITETILLNGETIPLHSLAVWRKNYELMGKEDKVRLMDEEKRKG